MKYNFKVIVLILIFGQLAFAGLVIPSSGGGLSSPIGSADISTGAVTTTQILDATIASADISTGAITTAKILDGTIVSGDLSSAAGIVGSQIADATLTSADVSSTGGIELTGAIQAKTTTYTALTTDKAINASGSAFTITLYAASGNAGRMLIVTKTDSTLANIVTIDANASETINGSLTTTLNTQYESLTLYCDGSNWIILNRMIPELFTSLDAPITGNGVAGTMTYAAKTLYWSRQGRNMRIQGNIRIATVTTSPSGLIYFPMPSGADWSSQVTASDAGRGPFGTTGSNITGVSLLLNFNGIASPNAQNLGMAKGDGTSIVFIAGDEVKVDVTIPITGWN